MAGRSRTCTALRPAEVVASGPALTGSISWAGTSDGAMARAGGTRHLDRLLAGAGAREPFPGPRLRACGEVPGGLPCADAAAPGRRPGPHRVQENTWHQGPSQAWPLVVIIMDECQQFLDGQAVKGRKPDEDQVRKCQFYVSQLVRKSRSVMMVTIRATQKPTIDSIPSGIRDNTGISLAFGVKTIESATAVLGADIRDYASFSPVGLQADELAGCLISTLKTGADSFPQIARHGS